MKVFPTLLALAALSAAACSGLDADAAASASASSEVIEHRSAKPEPFLDRLKQALFGSGTEKKQERPKRKPSVGYKRPAPPGLQVSKRSGRTGLRKKDVFANAMVYSLKK